MIHRYARILRVAYFLLCICWIGWIEALSVARRRTPFLGAVPMTRSRVVVRAMSSTWTMRDASASYWFQVNDRVRVVDDVWKANVNLRHWEGVVIQTWEKCNVDPTCCCAEQVDTGMAVQVLFVNNTSTMNENATTKSASGSTSSPDTMTIPSFTHHFAESELWKVTNTI